MKKIYIKPESVSFGISPLEVIASSPNLETGGGQTGDGDIEESTGSSRGRWGDVWGGK